MNEVNKDDGLARLHRAPCAQGRTSDIATVWKPCYVRNFVEMGKLAFERGH